jgi:hypothetical protein
MSHLREDFETLGKAVPATSLFLSYMESLFNVSRGKTGEGGWYREEGLSAPHKDRR